MTKTTSLVEFQSKEDYLEIYSILNKKDGYPLPKKLMNRPPPSEYMQPTKTLLVPVAGVIGPF